MLQTEVMGLTDISHGGGGGGEGKRIEKKGAADSQISGLGSKEMDSWSTKMPDFHRAKPFFRKKNLQPHV